MKRVRLQGPAAYAGGRRRVWAVAVVVVLAAGCGGGNQYAPPPPPDVTVARPVTREVTTYIDATGQTKAIEAVEIRARVQGVLQSMDFTPGSQVKQGDLLFVIEPELYQSRADQAKADLQSAQAVYAAAEEQLAITTAIFDRKAGSKTDMVQRTQARDQAAAAVEQMKARLAAAELDLSYTHIYAPISGRIDRNFVDLGNLVGAEKPTLLATMVRQDPIYAYFEVSERDLLVYRELNRLGKTATADGQRAIAYMALATEEGYPHVGEVDYASNQVNPSTGTFEARAVFPNPDGVLLPGLFVRLRIPFTRGQGLLVPDDALGSDQGGRYALVVDGEGNVQQRHVDVGSLVGGLRVIREGLTPDDWVIITGIQRARPGVKVTPKQTELPPAEAAGDAPIAGGKAYEAAATSPAADDGAGGNGSAASMPGAR
jgi:RND family efflux transporter MFP subunit